MNEDGLIAQIKGLELQLDVLKARLQRMRGNKASKPLAELRGILKGKVCSSEEEIDAAKYRFKWDNTEER